MGGISRNKGKLGERELAGLISEYLGYEVRRRVRQRDGDSDLEGVPGWCIEVKRHRTASRADLRVWWCQACTQAEKVAQKPVLAYRRDRDEWRMVWPVAMHLGVQQAHMWMDYAWTVEASVEAWASVVREVVAAERAGRV
jgi:hypothetical protein